MPSVLDQKFDDWTEYLNGKQPDNHVDSNFVSLEFGVGYPRPPLVEGL